MSNVMELSLRGASSLEKLMRAVLLDSENKVPADRLRIVGALSDGAIIESGSNANGNWVRLANGLQLCWFQSPRLGTQHDLYSVACTFPATFISAPTVISLNDVQSSDLESSSLPQKAFIWCIVPETLSLTGCTVTCLGYNTSLLTRYGRFFAIGKWK